MITNREIKVTIDYHAMEGRIGPRTVEPYSLRRSRQGNLLVYVVNDRGLLRCYRADRCGTDPLRFCPAKAAARAHMAAFLNRARNRPDADPQPTTPG